MNLYVGTIDGTITFPDEVSKDKDKCSNLIEQILEGFIEVLEKNNCEMYGMVNLAIDNKEA